MVWSWFRSPSTVQVQVNSVGGVCTVGDLGDLGRLGGEVSLGRRVEALHLVLSLEFAACKSSVDWNASSPASSRRSVEPVFAAAD